MLDIAYKIGCHPATIYEELQRGDAGRPDKNQRPEYDPRLAQRTFQVQDNRSLAEKVRDVLADIVNAVKRVLNHQNLELTAEQKAEFRELESRLGEMERLFSDALGKAEAQNGQKNTAQEGGTKFSIKETADGKKYVQADRQVIFGDDPNSWSEQLEDYINGKIRRGENVELIGADGDILLLTATSAGKLSDNHTNDGRTMSRDAYEKKVNAAAHIDELAQVSTRGNRNVADYNNRHGSMADGGWNYRTSYFMDFDGKYYQVMISVALGADGKMVYNIGQMQERSTPQINGSSAANSGALRGSAPTGSISETGQDVNNKKPAVSEGSSALESGAQESGGLFTDRVAQNGEEVKAKYSLKEDSQGQKLTDAQQEFFKDSKVRDKDGRLLPVYHATYDTFTVFDREKLGALTDGNATDENWAATSHIGFWFNTEDLSRKTGLGNRAENVYLNITDPYDAGTLEALATRMEQYEGTAAERGEAFWDWLNEEGYDGVVIRDEEVGGTSYVALSPEQIKQISNQNPTSDPDIRYSLKEYTANEKKQHVKDALAYFGRTFKWAETGYITTDGKRLDFSGRHDGGPGGYRTVDHRDISDALGLDYGGDDYSGAMVQFMGEGNIRISPESGGINLSMMPTKAQLDTLSDFISKQRGEVILDLDAPGGDTVFSTEYPRGTHASKVLGDIKAYFEEGKQPQVSEVARFRYSLKEFKDGKRFVDVQTDQKQFDGLSDAQKSKLAIQIIKARFKGKVIGIDNKVFVNGHSAAEYGHPVKRLTSEAVNAKMRASTELDNLIDAGTNFRTEPDGKDGHIHPKAIGDFRYFDTIFKVGNEYYKGVINIEHTARGLRLKDVSKIENITQDLYSSYGSDPKSVFLRDASMESIPESEGKVKEYLSRKEKDMLEEFRKEYGTIPKGEKPSREILLPRKTAADKKVSQTVRTILEAGATPEDMVPTVEDMVAKGDFSYDAYSDKKAIFDAESQIKKVGWAQALTDWTSSLSNMFDKPTERSDFHPEEQL